MADTNGTPTPGNGTSRPPLICSHPDEYKGDEGGCRMCQMPVLTKAVDAIRGRRPPPRKEEPAEDLAPPAEEVCSPLRAPPPPPSTFKAPSRCTCPDDSRWLADGSCDRCGAPAMRVVYGGPGEALAPSLADVAAELRSLILAQFEALRLELAKFRTGVVGPDVGPREIDVGPSPARHIQIVELQRRLGRGRTTIRDWYKADRFPAPHYCGALRCWYVREIEAWEEANRPRTNPPA